MWRPKEHGQVTLLIGVSQLIVTTDFSIVGVALPSIGRELAVAADLLSWVVAATSLALAGFLPYAAAVAFGGEGGLAWDDPRHFEDQRSRWNRSADRGL